MRDYTIFWSPAAGSDSTTSADSATTYDDTQGAQTFLGVFLGSSMKWNVPKTDWNNSSLINFEDFNAIEENTSVVVGYLESIQYDIPSLTVVTNRDYTSIDYLSSINRIENNLELIRNNFMTPSGYGGAESWVVGKGFDFTDANRLENNLALLLDNGVLVFESFKYCGTFNCGQTGRLA
jgi:hypothetical protein